jgi:hypothetical protein
MFQAFQWFGKHNSCRLQGEYVLGGFRKPYVEQAVGGEWDAKNLIGRTEERVAIQPVMNACLMKRGNDKSF